MNNKEPMNVCKHNWKESNFAQAHRKAGEYIFDCMRCGEYRYAALNTAVPRGAVVHDGAAQPAAPTAQAQAHAQTETQA